MTRDVQPKATEANKVDQGQSNQIQPNQAKSSQIKPNQTSPARTNLDLGRARWLRGNAKRKNGKAKCLSDRNIFLTSFTDEPGSGLAENVRLGSPVFAYVRLMGEKMSRAPRAGARDSEMHEMMKNEAVLRYFPIVAGPSRVARSVTG
jgi:hypothetical protein